MGREKYIHKAAGYKTGQLQKLLGGTGEKLRKACKKSVANRKLLELIAKQLADNAAEKEPEFNDYTGNLVSSYSADIYSNGYYQGLSRQYSKLKRGTIDTAPNGRKIAFLSRPPRHGARVKRRLSAKDAALTRHRYEISYNKKKLAEFRYLKPWERQSTGGYRDPSDIAHRKEARDMLKKARENETGKRFTARSYILLTNKAPYADFVQRGSNKRKHYNVLRGAYGARSLSHYNSLLKMITLQEIEDALKLPMHTNKGYERSISSAVRAKYVIRTRK